MNLLTLPDEMTARILNYTNYATVVRLRKLSAQINKVVNAYGIDRRFPVTSITFSSYPWFNNTTTFPWRYSLDFDQEDLNCYTNLAHNDTDSVTQRFNKDSGSHLDIIDNLLKKVKLNQTLNIFAFSHEVDDQLMAIFANNSRSLRNMVKFTIATTRITCSDSSVKHFIISARELRDYRISYYKSSTDVFSQIEELENRPWDYMHFVREHYDETFSFTRLNDDFLLKFVKNCKTFILQSADRRTSFTLNGVIELLKTLVEENITPNKIQLGLINTENLNFQETKEKLCSIHNAVICKSTTSNLERPGGPRTTIEICFSYNPEHAFLKFMIV